MINETIIQTVEKRNWNFYRDHYLAGDYSHDDLIQINNKWYSLIKDQVFFDKGWAQTFFDSYLREQEKYLQVMSTHG